MKRNPKLCLLALSGLLATAAAVAADTPAKRAGAEVAAACVEDVKTLCPGVEPGEGRIAACLKEHRRQVSAGCKDAIKAQRAEKKAGDK